MQQSGSISVGSSLSARELLTRFDTGQRCSTSFAAGLRRAVPPSFSHGSKSVRSRDYRIRSYISAATALGSATIMVQDLSFSPVEWCFHSSHSPANVRGSP